MTRRLDDKYTREITGRDSARCVPCGRGIRGKRGGTWDIWHRIPHDNRHPEASSAIRVPANLLTMCMPCIDLCTEHPLLARQFGYRVWRSVNPETVPVLYSGKTETAVWPTSGEMWLLSSTAAVRVRRTYRTGTATLKGLAQLRETCSV
jgi:hypothetical protein